MLTKKGCCVTQQPYFCATKCCWLKRIFNWERLPFFVIYAPFIFLWSYYWALSRRFWFFSNVNPTMYFSGFEGETKQEMFSQLPQEFCPVGIYIEPGQTFEKVLCQVKQAGLKFPFAVKPDVGTKGLLFRKIENEEQLKKYHALLPFTYMVQELITLPLELSVFHVRYPDEQKGMITGMIAKEYLHVKGDGVSTLRKLIESHPKAFMIEDEQKHKHKESLDEIIPENDIYLLNELGNHNRGATFLNLQDKIDDSLLKVFDEISLYSNYFYYGRYDIKTTSIEDMKAGKNFSILEFNGVGSEPNHIYDIGLSYMQALRIIAQHWKYMYEIGRINFQKGIPYIPFWKGIRMATDSQKNVKRMKQLDLECDF